MARLSKEPAAAKTGAAPSPVALSFDLDWAPDYMLDALGELLSRTKIPTTFFCTHESPAVRRLIALPNCETALHPNFRQPIAEEKVFSDLRAIFPNARGVRNHYLYYHSGLLSLFQSHNVQYFSNDLMFLQSNLAPYRDWSGLLRLPIFWEDDVHCVCFTPPFSLSSLNLERPGMKIFNLHPVHVWLNTARLDDYRRAKATLADADKTSAFRNTGSGIRTLFDTLLTWLADQPVQTLATIAQNSAAPR